MGLRAALVSLGLVCASMTASAQHCGPLKPGTEDANCVRFGRSQEFDKHPPCRVITNHHVRRLPVMVPLGSRLEWQRFLANLPPGVTEEACGSDEIAPPKPPKVPPKTKLVWETIAGCCDSRRCPSYCWKAPPPLCKSMGFTKEGGSCSEEGKRCLELGAKRWFDSKYGGGYGAPVHECVEVEVEE